VYGHPRIAAGTSMSATRGSRSSASENLPRPSLSMEKWARPCRHCHGRCRREQQRSPHRRSRTGSGAGGESRDGEWSMRRIEGSRRTGIMGRSVRELGERFGSRNERTVFLTDDSLFTYHGFVTITSSSRIISRDNACTFLVS
jgi:hypothetical protein